MKIQLSDHFTYGKLMRFTFSSIAMMIFTSVYGVIDGLFVSNYVGKTPFAALNFIYPVIMMLGAVGFMFGTGGTALVAIALGEGKKDKANKLFSLFVYTTIICGITLALLGIIFIRPIGMFLGATGELLDLCVLYARIVLMALPMFMLQMEFQNFFVTAEKPQLGLYMTVAAGVTNMVLDWLFIAVFEWGLAGAASATALSQTVGGGLSLVYFIRKNSSLLRLTKLEFDGKALVSACVNGSSELMSNISMSLVSMLYNVQLMKYAGENGVSAYGVLMYVSLVFLAIFIGYAIGTAPIFGFHYGAANYDELKSLFKKSFVIVGSVSVFMVIASNLLSTPLSEIFVGYDANLYEITKRGFFIYSFSFLFCGLCIFGSSFFTALGDGLTSALISFLRTLVFQVAAVMILPLIWEIDGIWISIVVAECLAAIVTSIFLVLKRKKFHY